MRKSITLASLSALAVAASIVLVAPMSPPSVAEAVQPAAAVATVVEPAPASPLDGMAMVSGTVRWVNSSTWVALDDAGHTPTGIASVEVTSSYVKINHDFTASKISSFQATVDEAFASAHVTVGASVGYNYTILRFYMPGSSAPVNPTLLSKFGANVWLTGFFHVAP